jgi:hypothetical protein
MRICCNSGIWLPMRYRRLPDRSCNIYPHSSGLSTTPFSNTQPNGYDLPRPGSLKSRGRLRADRSRVERDRGRSRENTQRGVKLSSQETATDRIVAFQALSNGLVPDRTLIKGGLSRTVAGKDGVHRTVAVQ